MNLISNKPFMASAFLNLVLGILLAGCSTANSDAIVELLSADTNPDNPNSEIVCVRGSLNGRFTDTDIVYLKKVYPKGEPAPEC